MGHLVLEDRLHDEVVHAGLKGRLLERLLRVGSHAADVGLFDEPVLRDELPYFPRALHTRHLRHAVVHQDQLVPLLAGEDAVLYEGEGLRAIARRVALKVVLLEQAPRDHAIELAVVDDEDLQQAALAVLALTIQLA